jgi:hypothetical protein
MKFSFLKNVGDDVRSLKSTKEWLRGFLPAATLNSQPSTLNPGRVSESGIALVITLILLSVITFMAVTFLVITRGERSTVSVITEQTTARLAADAALEAGKAELIAPMLAFSNASTVSLIVSTNYQSPGFTNGSASFLNVNYDHTSVGGPLTPAQALQNLANLCYLPRVPVFITNRLVANSNEFRFYLDLNRNGRYDTNGLVALIGNNGNFIDGTGNSTTDPTKAVYQSMTGDPEWVGILERGGYTPSLMNGLSGSAFPRNYGHSSSNLFISRYSFIVVPSSMTLDINALHNYSKQITLNGSGPMGTGDYFVRNMGVGSYEINLAAFLTDLNTNFWPYPNDTTYGVHYAYDTSLSRANTGAAFDDAVAILRYRYATNWFSLSNVPALFGNAGKTAFLSDSFDGYSAGPLMMGFHPGIIDPDQPARFKLGWAGSDNVNAFFDTQDLFDPNKTRVGVPAASYDLSSRLIMAGRTNSTYDRYTFYRLLSQLGTDSAPETPKMNLNYANIDANGTIVPNMATNFLPWNPVQFFTNAAMRLLADAGYDTNVVNKGQLHIQIYPTNYYTPSVHRLLQLAANIFDAGNSRNYVVGVSNGFPTIFQPQFTQGGAVAGTVPVYITGYTEVTNLSAAAAISYWEVNNPAIAPNKNIMIHGIPMIVGARKGFPSFNEYGMLNDITVRRRLTFHRDVANGPVTRTNQLYQLTIANTLGLELWNSFSNTYPRNLQLSGWVDVLTFMTNEAGASGVLSVSSNSIPINTPVLANTWLGYQGDPTTSNSFRLPLGTNYIYITNANYVFAPAPAHFVAGTPVNDSPNLFNIPHWWLHVTNRIHLQIIDTDAARVVDVVNLASADPPIDITDQLMRTDDGTGYANCQTFKEEIGSLFCTNRFGGGATPNYLPYGVLDQYMISMGASGYIVKDGWWRSYNADSLDKTNSIAQFQKRILGTDKTQQDFSAPFTPQRIIHHNISWQANDPLVHYMVSDLVDLMSDKKPITFDQDTNNSPLTDLGGRAPLNAHFRPWAGNPNKATDTDPPTNWRLEVKDPIVVKPDDWDFPTNKFPNIGWLGRVHRGTPWQTVYLKAAPIDEKTWTHWTGNTNYVVMTNGASAITNYDFVQSLPTNDFRTLNLFTTAFNDNASRGQLSVNQTNLAAWSAVLAGVLVNSNAFEASSTNIQPAGTYDQTSTATLPPVVRILAGINGTRTNFAGTFNRVGDILATPELTVGLNPKYIGAYPNGYWGGVSPFLDLGDPATIDNKKGSLTASQQSLISDEAYERIPQQIMSLLRNDSAPRFVIYAFGQALKPAEHSIYLGTGPFFGMVTNYQITAEAATRAVVHVEGAPAAPHVVVDSYNVLPPY